MQWSSTIQQSVRRGRVVLYRATSSDGGGWPGVRESFGEFWIMLARSLREEYETASKPDWEVVYCEIWPDSGRLIGYPGLRSRARRIERVVVQVSVPMIEKEYYGLSESGNTFEREHDHLMGRLAEEAAVSARSENVAPRLTELIRWHPAEIRILWYDDDLPGKTVVLSP